MSISMLISAEERKMYAAKAVAQEFENALLEQRIIDMKKQYITSETEDADTRAALLIHIGKLEELRRNLNGLARALEKLGSLK